LVSYTLIRNPSLQQYTVHNMALVANQEMLKKQKRFVLDQIIKNVAEDQELRQRVKAKQDNSDNKKWKSEESTEVEVICKKMDDFGEDIVPVYSRYC